MKDLGGYQILDLKGYNFTVGTKATISGVWGAVDGSTYAVMVCNLVVAGKEFRNTWIVDLKFDNTNYVGTIYDYTITIANDDGITISSKA